MIRVLVKIRIWDRVRVLGSGKVEGLDWGLG